MLCNGHLASVSLADAQTDAADLVLTFRMADSALEAACVSALATRDVQGMLSLLSALPHDLAERAANMMRDEGNAHLKSAAYDKALASYTKSLLVTPNDARTHANMSMCYMKMKKLAEAETAAREAIRSDGKWSKGYYRLGCALQSQRREEEALAEFKLGLKCEPESDALRQKVSEITCLLQVSAMIKMLMMSVLICCLHTNTIINNTFILFKQPFAKQQRQSVLSMMMGEGAAPNTHQSATVNKDGNDDAALFPLFETARIHHTHQDFSSSKTATPAAIPHDPASKVLIEYLNRQTLVHSPRRDLEYWLSVTQQSAYIERECRFLKAAGSAHVLHIGTGLGLTPALAIRCGAVDVTCVEHRTIQIGIIAAVSRESIDPSKANCIHIIPSQVEGISPARVTAEGTHLKPSFVVLENIDCSGLAMRVIPSVIRLHRANIIARETKFFPAKVPNRHFFDLFINNIPTYIHTYIHTCR